MTTTTTPLSSGHTADPAGDAGPASRVQHRRPPQQGPLTGPSPWPLTPPSQVPLAAGVPSGARHLPGLTGVDTVDTLAFKAARASLSRVVRSNGIAAVSGASGNGKSFTVNDFLHHNAVAAQRPKVWLDIPQDPSPKEVTMRLLQLLGVRFNSRDSQYTLVEELVPQLVGRDLILVIDEAQYLKTKGLQQLRYFHDRSQPLTDGDPNGFTLILVGSDVDKALAGAAELRSRVTSWIRFEPMTAKDMLIAVRTWHPLMAQLPPRTLLDIDRTFGRGNWRNWAQVLAALIDLHTKATARHHEHGAPMPELAALTWAAVEDVKKQQTT